jgi:hypothetical protein
VRWATGVPGTFGRRRVTSAYANLDLGQGKAHRLRLTGDTGQGHLEVSGDVVVQRLER